jgi:hypothetical protein
LASGHLASFDRRKCTGPLNGAAASGQHCPEGWTLYPEPAPQLKGVTESGSAESSYYTWVDQFDTLGLGANVAINTGNASEALLALQNGRFVTMRQVDGRSYRQSGGRVERSRRLVDDQHTGAVPHGDRQGHDQQGHALPGPAEPAREVT